MDIKVKYLRDVTPLELLPQGDWIDVRAAEDVALTGKRQMIPLGFALELPEGYEAHLVPRSSTFKKYGIIQTNGVGVVDESYCGDGDEWFMPVLQMEFVTGTIKKNTRIAQFRIMSKQPRVNFITVDHLGNTDRGGCGSTGEM